MPYTLSATQKSLPPTEGHAGAHPSAIGGGEPPAKKPKAVEPVDPTKFIPKEIWMQILGFVGPGHYIYLALVSKKFKQSYLASFGTPAKNYTDCIHVLWTVKEYVEYGALRLGRGERPVTYSKGNGRGALRLGNGRPATSNDTYYRAVFSSVACANYWKKFTAEDPRRPDDDLICRLVAKCGKVAVLQWAQEQEGFGWNGGRYMIEWAARGGNLEIIKYLREVHHLPWDNMTCTYAAMNGHLEVLKYYHESNGRMLELGICTAAAGNGHLECLKYAHSKGARWYDTTCSKAAKGGHLEVLKWLHRSGCPWSTRACEIAAESGHLEVLKWLHRSGCPWNTRACESAAESGHLEVLQYLRGEECPWNDRTCIQAARGGHLQVLIWARGNGCPWNEAKVIQAIGEHRFFLGSARRAARRVQSILDWLNQEDNV